MKKTVLTLLLAGGCIAVFAQETDTTKRPKTVIDSTQQGWRADTMMNRDTTTRNQTETLISSGDYNAYRALNIPVTVTRTFESSYPNVPEARWSKSYNGDWRVVYRYNGQNMNTYYSNRGESYNVALPVLQNMVSEEVVNKAVELYGMNIYDVTRLKAVDSTMEVYQVRTLDNGQLRTEVIGADGSAAPAGWNDLSKLEGGMQRNVMPDSAKMNMNMQRNNMAPDSSRMMQNMRDTSMMKMRDTSMQQMHDTMMMHHDMSDSAMMKKMKDSMHMNMDMKDSMKMKMDDSTMMKHHMRDSTMKDSSWNKKDSSMMNMNNNMNNTLDNSAANNVNATENENANKEMKAGENTDVKIKSKTADGKSKMKNKDGKIKTKNDQ